jgi:hypothetical protein
MIRSQYRSVSLAFMLCVIPAFAGSHYTRMSESKPVVENGLEFVAAVEDEWVCFNSGRDPIQVQLFIRNVTDKPLLFQTFDTFGIRIKEKSGKQIQVGGGRDVTLRTKSVIIEPGARYCLSRNAELVWNADGKSRTFIYYDGTGTVVTSGPLTAGGYTLSFYCHYEEKTALKNDDAKFSRWTGNVESKEVVFNIMDPQPSHGTA